MRLSKNMLFGLGYPPHNEEQPDKIAHSQPTREVTEATLCSVKTGQPRARHHIQNRQNAHIGVGKKSTNTFTNQQPTAATVQVKSSTEPEIDDTQDQKQTAKHRLVNLQVYNLRKPLKKCRDDRLLTAMGAWMCLMLGILGRRVCRKLEMAKAREDSSSSSSSSSLRWCNIHWARNRVSTQVKHAWNCAWERGPVQIWALCNRYILCA